MIIKVDYHMIKGLKHLFIPGRSKRTGTVQPGKEKAQGDPVSACKHLEQGCKDDRSRLFSVVPSGRTRGRGHEMKCRRLCLMTRKHFFGFFFYCESDRALHSLPREVVERSPSLQVFRSHLDMVLGNWL